MKLSSAKIIAGVVALAAVFAFVGSTPAQALTAADISAQIAALQAQLNAVSGSNGSCSYVFTQTLKLGSTGTEVMNLQKVLNMSTDTQVSVSGAGSPGNETSYYGPATRAAVIKFQNKYAAQILAPLGLSSGTGTVAAATRAQLNAMCSGTTTTGTGTGTGTVTSGPVSVSLGNTSTYGALVSPSAVAPLATYVFSGNGTVTNLTLQRTGVSTDSTLTNVYLYNGATRLTDSASVVNGVITFNNPNGLFTVNGSMTVTIRGDVASGNAGQTLGVTLSSYSTLGGSMMSANLPGTLQAIAANSNPATVQVGVNTVTAQSVNAGTSNYTIWSAPITVSTRSVNLQGATFKYIGSAPTNALTNLQLYVDGVAVGPMATVNSNTNFLTFDLSGSPYVLNTGSHTLSVEGNIVGGANRNFQLSLQNPGDIMAADSQLQGVFVSPTTVGFSSFQTNNSGLVTINNGTITVQTDPSFSTQTTVTGGATQVPIAQYLFTAYGESVKISQLTIEPMLNNAATSLNNVSIFANGAQIGSSQNDASSTALTYNLGSSLIIPAGQTVTVTVKADTIRNDNNVAISTGNLSVALIAGSSNGQGQSSSQLVNVPTSNITSNTVSVGSATANVALNTAFTNQTVAPNTSNVKVGSFVIQAGSSEGLRVTNIQVNLGGTLGASTSTANLKIVAGGVTSNPVSPSSSNNFPVNFTIPVSGTATVDVYADITTASSGTIQPSIIVNALGASSNVSVTGSATGQTSTVGTGALSTPTVTSATPTAQFVVGGTSALSAATFNFVSTTTAATIQELKFTISGTGSTTAVSSISVGGVSAPVVGNVADITGLNIQVPAGYAGVDVPVTPSFNAVGVNGVNSGSTVAVNLTLVKSLIGNTSTTTTFSNGTVAGNSLTVVASKPTVSLNNGSTNGLVSGQVEIADVTVSADAAGPIAVRAIPLSISTSGNTSFGSQQLVIEDANGSTISTSVASSTTFSVASSSNGTVTINFNNGYRISAGSSQTFRIFATASNVSGNAGTQSVTTQLGAASNFKWDDINGNSTNISGSLIQNYPSGTRTITN